MCLYWSSEVDVMPNRQINDESLQQAVSFAKDCSICGQSKATMQCQY
jgi:hypothetical protein